MGPHWQLDIFHLFIYRVIFKITELLNFQSRTFCFRSQKLSSITFSDNWKQFLICWLFINHSIFTKTSSCDTKIKGVYLITISIVTVYEAEFITEIYNSVISLLFCLINTWTTDWHIIVGKLPEIGPPSTLYLNQSSWLQSFRIVYSNFIHPFTGLK